MSSDGSASTIESAMRGVGLAGLLGLEEEEQEGACTCDVWFEERTLVVDASTCDGDLANAPDCRATVVDALAARDATGLTVRSNGLQHNYPDEGCSLLGAAGRFADLLGDRDDRLAEEVHSDPLAVAEEVRNRVGPVADVARESGLLQAARGVERYADVLAPTVGLELAYYYVENSLGDEATLQSARELDNGSFARIYERPDRVPLYHLDVVDLELTAEERALIAAGYEAIAYGVVEGDRAASRAIEYVSDGPVDPRLASILAKHTSGYGILEDLFGDPRVSDVYATSPVEENPLRVEVDGQSMLTNLHLTTEGAEALGSRVRRTSGRAFSRAAPTVDATADLNNGTGLRVAGVTDPVAQGVAFAFREKGSERFTVPALVANDTMPAEVAAFLSIAIERNAAALVAGTRGAGKTTLLGTLLYELTPDTRTVVIEDTPELPVSTLQNVDRDVQALRTGSGEGPEITPADALHTALRLGDGALVVGEIRGEEAQVLYEAMRVGANANAVLGTIHGDGADDVYERVVSDLGVAPTSFAVTDLVITVQSYRTPDGRKRRLARVEEVMNEDDDVWFEPLYVMGEDQAQSTGRIDRGESRVVEHLVGPGESYADVRRAIEARSDQLRDLARDGRLRPREVAAAYAEHRE